MSGGDFARGFRPQLGERLGDPGFEDVRASVAQRVELTGCVVAELRAQPLGVHDPLVQRQGLGHPAQFHQRHEPPEQALPQAYVVVAGRGQVDDLLGEIRSRIDAGESASK